jgi:tetratricopeptide (TPR) repeat protein
VARVRLSVRGLAVGLAGFAAVAAARAADPADVQKDLLKGEYANVIKSAESALKETPGNSEWAMLQVGALLAVGRNADADLAMKIALERDQTSIRLRWLARDVAFANGRPEEAKDRVDEIRRMIADRRWMYARSPADMIVYGRAALLLGADPKDVLDQLYVGMAQKAAPKLRDVYLARGELALDKHDFAIAARAYEEGLKQLPDDPDLLTGRAKAYAGGDVKVALESLKAALEINPRHVPSLLQIADHHIDAEAYDEAGKVLDDILKVNPVQPDAWAYRAVIAHLRNDTAGEKAAREKALSSWAKNPRVDFLIGQKLAAKYRFAEAAAYERRAREFDPTYLPAVAELAQSLLRLGEEAEGWALAQAVHERDDYDVEAFNLVTLRDSMAKYASLTSDDFVLRMSTQEVAVYGPRVLELLRRARKTLTEKYGAQLANPTYVEVFADQKDFAVRTFGLPDIPGFLGVCFGRVVTANSPATTGHPTNWESVLWHEFCHVVTLQLTKNKMPRWLSEGISVYEERQANPSWGMRLNSGYKEMIDKGDLVPVGKLSGAFLAPKTPRHLQFAYLESAMVVEFIVDRFGIAALRGVLNDLRTGAEINVALAKNTVPLEQLEKDFDKYARDQAQQLAPKLDWEKPDPDLLRPNAASDLAEWGKKHPDNFWLLRYQGARAATEQRWPEARKDLERLVELYPEQKGTDTAYRTLVSVLHSEGDTAAERAVLNKWAQVDDEAPDAYLRLMELAAGDKDWPTVHANVQRYLGVNPLVAPPYRYLAEASAATGDDAASLVAWRTLLQLDTPDPAEAHFKLAQVLHRRGEDFEAKRHALLALEETPRYRDALRLLVEVKDAKAETAVHAPASDILIPGTLKVGDEKEKPKKP